MPVPPLGIIGGTLHGYWVNELKMSQEIQQKLICPTSKGKLKRYGEYLESVIDPGIRYPIIEGCPVLINDANSLFSIEDFTKRANTTIVLNESKFKQLIRKMIPGISVNIKAEQNYREIATLLPENAKVLVIGGSIKGQGKDAIYDKDSFEVIGSDVSFGPIVNLICDAHDVPFEENTFDCVIIQAVLEHVLDPLRCVAEVHRVLKPDGIVYAETPFIQQVHLKQYDFTRFTHLGHRRLFRCFEELKSGPACGPGMALAWSYTYFLKSFASSKIMGLLLTQFAYMTSFFLKYFDYYLIDKPGSYDAASGFFFMGKKSDRVLSDRELITQFKGVG